MELALKRLPNTPYKIVSFRGKVIGITDSDKFVHKNNLSQKHIIHLNKEKVEWKENKV